MRKEEKRRPNEWMRLRVRLAWQLKRLRCFAGAPKFDLRFKLIVMSAISPAIAIFGGALASNGLLGAGFAFVLYLIGATLGLLVLVTLGARFLDDHFADFKAAKGFGVALFALATFVAHGRAVGEVNSIFHVDASALPHTTAAASAMIISIWVYLGVLLPICIISVICALYFFGRARRGNAMISFAVFIAALLWASLIDHQIAQDDRRKSNLYQIALEMDFNKRSNCLGVPEQSEGVVFIGPDQLRAIAAPRMVERSRSSKSIFRGIDVPSKFDVVKCL
jgi:hypothetical protein